MTELFDERTTVKTDCYRGHLDILTFLTLSLWVCLTNHVWGLRLMLVAPLPLPLEVGGLCSSRATKVPMAADRRFAPVVLASRAQWSWGSQRYCRWFYLMALPLTHGIGCILDALTAGTLQMVLVHCIACNSRHKLPKLKAHCRHSDVLHFIF